jgi:hypothetical protein
MVDITKTTHFSKKSFHDETDVEEFKVGEFYQLCFSAEFKIISCEEIPCDHPIIEEYCSEINWLKSGTSVEDDPVEFLREQAMFLVGSKGKNAEPDTFWRSVPQVHAWLIKKTLAKEHVHAIRKYFVN